MAKVVYLVQLNDRAAVVTPGRELSPGNRVMVHQLVFAFSSKDAAQDFCRRQTRIEGSDPWDDGPTCFRSVDPESRLAKEAWISEVQLDPVPTLPGMEGI